jgi:hypothetical protein
LSIIKSFLRAISVISGNVNVNTTISVVPVVNRYTATVVLGNILNGVTTIPAQNFTNDTGTAVPTGGLVTPAANGYYDVFVNGTLQRGGLTTLTSTSLIINTGLLIGATIVLEVVRFTGSAVSTSTNNLSVDTSILS